MTFNILLFNLPYDIIHNILINYDGRFKIRNGKFCFQLKFHSLFNNTYVLLQNHFINILKLSVIRDEIYKNCILINSYDNMVYYIKKYIKIINLHYLYN